MSAINRKLPDDATLSAIIRFGFNNQSIADEFDCSQERVSMHRKRLGFPKLPSGRKKTNGSPPTNNYNPRFPQVRNY